MIFDSTASYIFNLQICVALADAASQLECTLNGQTNIHISDERKAM